MEPTISFLERVNMLEGFKRIDVTYFDLEFESTQQLYDLAVQYISEDRDFIDPRDNRLHESMLQPNRYGPIDGHYYSVLEAEQINCCFAIKSGDITWIKDNMFNQNLSSSWIYYNYNLFKSVFAWIIPHFPTKSKVRVIFVHK